jgi:hypothetical protein
MRNLQKIATVNSAVTTKIFSGNRYFNSIGNGISH